MKIIESAGGPLIGIHCAHLDRWNGVFGRNFFERNFVVGSDYDILCSLVLSEPSLVIDVIKDGSIDVFLMASEPFPTFIVEAGSDHIYIAQIDTSEEGWSESQLRSADFEAAIEWQQPIDFRSPGGEIVFFDSACQFADVVNDHLSATLDEGVYTCEWARQKWEGKANLIFIRMMKQGIS